MPENFGSSPNETNDLEESPSEAMAEMVEFIAKAIAGNPESVKVKVEEEDRQVTLYLLVHEDDKGKVIGRNGRVAQSIRSLLRVSAVKADTRAVLEIE
ncbi:KH domain-containing protein [Dehalococcoidia bacterium]|nr:KH domain-containing protein [Dehalococcoidia bacterium]